MTDSEQSKKCCLYRHYDQHGTLLYVGISIPEPDFAEGVRSL
jgi:hypothetical protein